MYRRSGPTHTTSSQQSAQRYNPSTDKRVEQAFIEDERPDQRLSLKFDGFNVALKDRYKKAFQGLTQWDAQAKHWHFPYESLEAVQAFLQSEGVRAICNGVRRQHLSQASSQDGTGQQSQKPAQRELTIEDCREDGRLVARFDYNKELVELVRKINGRKFEREEGKIWHFDRAELESAQRIFEEGNVQIQYEGGMFQEREQTERIARTRNMVADLDPEEIDSRLEHISANVWDKLFPFQQDGVKFGIQRGGRILLADEPGLGKTVQALLIAAAFPESWPLLIVCPSTLKSMWEKSLKEWLPAGSLAGLSINLISSSKDVDDTLKGRDLGRKSAVIISYELVKSLPRQLCSQFNFIILDESHRVKIGTTRWTTFLRPLVQQAQHAILVTGTPIQGKPIEYFSQVDMICRGLLGTRDEFGVRYCGGQKTSIGNSPPDYNGSSNERELSRLLHETIMIRRSKKDHLKDLPDKIRSAIPVRLDESYKQELQLVRKSIEDLENNPSLSEQERKTLWNTLSGQRWRTTGVAKIKGSREHLTTLLENKGHKVLVFAHHSNVMDGLQAGLLEALGPGGYIRIDGSTPVSKRPELCGAFQTQAACRAALLSIEAVGVGTTLTAATVVVFVELLWDPTKLEQAEDRAHRVGQTKALQVQYMVADEDESADGPMWRTLRRKMRIVGTAVNGSRDAGATGLDFNEDSVVCTPPNPEGDRQAQVQASPIKSVPSLPPASAQTSQPHGQLTHAEGVLQEPFSPARSSQYPQPRQVPSAPRKRTFQATLDGIEEGESGGVSKQGVGRRLFEGHKEPAADGQVGTNVKLEGIQRSSQQPAPLAELRSPSALLGGAQASQKDKKRQAFDLASQAGVFEEEDDGFIDLTGSQSDAKRPKFDLASQAGVFEDEDDGFDNLNGF